MSPIAGADQIEQARVMGWTVVVKRGEFAVGDPCVFFEIDSVLPDGPAWSEFMRPRGFRVRTIRLRGVLSQGLALPVAILGGEVSPREVDLRGRLGVGGQHASALTLADGSEISAEDALALIDAGAILYMIPPPGAPAHAAHVATGLPLLLQTWACPDCGKRVHERATGARTSRPATACRATRHVSARPSLPALATIEEICEPFRSTLHADDVADQQGRCCARHRTALISRGLAMARRAAVSRQGLANAD